MSINDARLKIAVQKSGRLSQRSLDLLSQCGLKFDWHQKALINTCQNYPIDLMLLRDDDIPEYVRDGICDLGIVGLNVVSEDLDFRFESQDKQPPVRLLRRLNFGHCRLSLASPHDSPYADLGAIQGKKIATSYPNLTRRFLVENRLEAKIVTISGSVEIAPSLGIADLICDLVSTGGTLRSHNLRENHKVMTSESVLIQYPGCNRADHQTLIDRIASRIDGVLAADDAKYIMMNAPRNSVETIRDLVPGMEDPTIIPLSDNKVAIHAVARESDFWDTIETLKSAGASSILVVPIEKIIQ